MKRTSAAGNVNNLYTDGTFGVTPATALVAEDRNMHQEELANAVLCAGLNLDTTGADKTQLWQAIQRTAKYVAGSVWLQGADMAMVVNGSAAVTYVDATATVQNTSGLAYRGYLPVHLPDGAIITSLYAEGFANTAGDNIEIVLQRCLFNYNTGSLLDDDLATVTVVTGDRDVEDTSIAYPTVDNQSYTYRLRVTITNGGTEANSRFYRAKVSYEAP